MPNRTRFLLSSEQCELLAAFEASGSLSELARVMHRDVSVVSRHLQGLGEAGVLQKRDNRWVITPLGRQLSRWTQSAAATQQKIIDQQNHLRLLNSDLPALTPRTALILVGMQAGFHHPVWGGRNNLQAEETVARVLARWRQEARPVYHIQHCSRQQRSPLRFGTLGCEFMQELRPMPGETLICKNANSAFVGTDLEKLLRERDQHSLVICGFSTNHCVDATARTAGDLGFSAFVIEDGCVAIDRIAADGTTIRAEETQRVVMANLNQEFATVISADLLLAAADLSSSQGSVEA